MTCPKVWLCCRDLNEAELGKVQGCCNSCHDEVDGGYSDPPKAYPPRNRNGRESRVATTYCCGFDAQSFTRQDFAKALKAKRRREREGGAGK